MRVLSPRMLPPESALEGSMVSTATLWPASTRFMPKESISVDFPAPGTPEMPTRMALPVRGKSACRSASVSYTHLTLPTSDLV